MKLADIPMTEPPTHFETFIYIGRRMTNVKGKEVLKPYYMNLIMTETVSFQKALLKAQVGAVIEVPTVDRDGKTMYQLSLAKYKMQFPAEELVLEWRMLEAADVTLHTSRSEAYRADDALTSRLEPIRDQMRGMSYNRKAALATYIQSYLMS